MEYAEESKETTYFDEEAATAKEAVDGALVALCCVLPFQCTIVVKWVLHSTTTYSIIY